MSTRRTYTPDEKAAALELYRTDGPTAVEKRMGIPKKTVSSWAARAGVRTDCIQTQASAVAGMQLTMAERRQRLAASLMDDIERLRLQLWSKCIRKEVVTVSDGRDSGSHVEIVDVELDQPTFSEQKAIMTTLAIAVDKVQILTGEATQRTEIIGDVARPQAEERLAKLIELRRAS